MTPGGRAAAAATLVRLRVLVVAGVTAGVVVVGLGSRIAMLLLRLTSPAQVRGVVSDDGFEIGRVTIFGTYNLFQIGAVVGVLGAVLYTWVAPWLIGPKWFRRLTTAAGAGVVVGSMLVHADGVDFTLLQPHWFAVALFVILPALFGWAIGVAVDRVRARPAPTGPRRWVVPIALVVVFPLLVVVLVPVVVVLFCWCLLRATVPVEEAQRSLPVAIGVRGAWLSVAVAGLVALVGDVGAVM